MKWKMFYDEDLYADSSVHVAYGRQDALVQISVLHSIAVLKFQEKPSSTGIQHNNERRRRVIGKTVPKPHMKPTSLSDNSYKTVVFC